MARLNVMPAPTVVVPGVRHRADDAELVGDRGRAGKMLANPQPGRAAVDRTEGAADRVRGLRLHIKCFELARSAEKEQEDG